MDLETSINDEIRNVGIIAHIDAGKTSLTERILQRAGVIRYAGEVSEGTTVTDWLQQERERGISIISAAVTCRWHGVQINLVDTPGHVDFTAEVERTLQVLDGVIAVFCGVHGVQAQSETVWRRAKAHGIPVIAFVNKLDRVGADYERVVDDIEAHFGMKAVPLQIPLGKESGFTGMADVLTGRQVDEDGKCVLDSAAGGNEALREAVAFGRYRLIDALSEVDEGILEDVLEERDPGNEKICRALCGAVARRELVPVFGGSARMGLGVRALLDGIRAFLPSPQAVRTEDGGNAGAFLLVFKVQQEAGDSQIQACVRIYGGVFHAGDRVWNARLGHWQILESINRMFAGSSESVDMAGDGDIVMVMGQELEVATGDMLFAERQEGGAWTMAFPEPVVSMTLEGIQGTDSASLGAGLARMCQADPTLRAHQGPLAGQWTLEGMGELHLEVVRERLQTEWGLNVATGRPQVSYRKTVKVAGDGECMFEKRLVTGELQRAGVQLSVVPTEQGSGIECDFSAVGGGMSESLGEFLEMTLRQMARNGLEDESALTDVRLIVRQVHCFEGETTEPALMMACRKALSDAVQAGGPVILEPVMAVEISLPEEYVGKALEDLMARRGRVTEVTSCGGGLARIISLVPLGELFGYASSLRSLSCGRGDFAAEPSAYVPMQSC